MSNARARVPLVWILKGPKAGDYAQLQLLARALDMPTVTKRLVFKPWELLLHAWPRPTLAALDRAASDALESPWPDLLLTAGRRNELVARWVHNASGGTSHLVHVGRPWSNPQHFDMVVSNRQYLLESCGNVIVNDLPLTDVNTASDEQTNRQPEWTALPRPWRVVLVGGDSGPLVFTPECARTLAHLVNDRTARTGGSVLLSTSGRTPPRSADALIAALRSPAFVHRWPSADNPYRELLACADEFIVTADSMSMLAEACATSKPVYLFDDFDATRSWLSGSAYRWKPLVHRLTMSIGPRRMRRDVRRIHQVLLDSGRIRRLRPDAGTPTAMAPRSDDLARTVARVRALLRAD